MCCVKVHPNWLQLKMRKQCEVCKILNGKEDSKMKSWHIGLIVVLLVVYLVGVKFPAPGAMVLSKVGL